MEAHFPFCFFLQDDEVVLQCTATVHKEQQKLCLAAEGFGNRLCFLESTSNSKVGRELSRLMEYSRFTHGTEFVPEHCIAFYGTNNL